MEKIQKSPFQKLKSFELCDFLSNSDYIFLVKSTSAQQLQPCKTNKGIKPYRRLPRAKSHGRPTSIMTRLCVAILRRVDALQKKKRSTRWFKLRE